MFILENDPVVKFELHQRKGLETLNSIDYSKTESLAEIFMACKESVLLHVAEQVLKRKPERADAGKFYLITSINMPMFHECFYFGKLCLGIIMPVEERDGMIKGWVFEPSKEFGS